jgi:abequosyltransferase
MMLKPVLTIAIPTYNRSDLLENLFNSIITEGVDKNFQLTIVVCDNSNDNKTEKIATQYKKLINLVYCKNKNNIGAGRNIIKCLDFIKSGFLHIVSDKTIFNKSYINVMLHIADRQPPLAFLNYAVYQNKFIPSKTQILDSEIN